MAQPEDTKGPFILWLDYGYDGWQPKSFATIRAALESEKYGTGFVITKAVEYQIVECAHEQNGDGNGR